MCGCGTPARSRRARIVGLSVIARATSAPMPGSPSASAIAAAGTTARSLETASTPSTACSRPAATTASTWVKSTSTQSSASRTRPRRDRRRQRRRDALPPRACRIAGNCETLAPRKRSVATLRLTVLPRRGKFRWRSGGVQGRRDAQDGWTIVTKDRFLRVCRNRPARLASDDRGYSEGLRVLDRLGGQRVYRCVRANRPDHRGRSQRILHRRARDVGREALRGTVARGRRANSRRQTGLGSRNEHPPNLTLAGRAFRNRA